MTDGWDAPLSDKIKLHEESRPAAMTGTPTDDEIRSIACKVMPARWNKETETEEVVRQVCEAARPLIERQLLEEMREPSDAMILAGHKQIDWCRNDQDTFMSNHPSQSPGTSCEQDLTDAFLTMLDAFIAERRKEK